MEGIAIMTLTPQQQKAVTTTDPYVCVVAGPGSGKSRVITERVKYLIATGTDPKSIACVSFTNAASNVLQERLRDIQLGVNSTLHAFMLRILNQSGEHSILDDEQREALISESIANCSYKGTRTAIDFEISLGPIRYGASVLSGPQLVARQFFRTMRRSRMVDFDSILWFALEKIQEAVFSLPLGLKHLIVDECQDASETDFKIYSALSIENKFFVGDFDQRIYSFRRASGEFLKLCKSTLHQEKK